MKVVAVPLALALLAAAAMAGACGSWSHRAGDSAPDASPPAKPPRGQEEDGSRPDMWTGGSAGEIPVDAARPHDVATREAAGARDVAVDLPADAADAGREDSRVSASACTAGHTCAEGSHCERACFGNLVYRCSCAEGRFVCTGCVAAMDAMASSTVDRCSSTTAQGRRCDHPGRVCRIPVDGGDKFCVCGEVGQDRIWICQ